MRSDRRIQRRAQLVVIVAAVVLTVLHAHAFAPGANQVGSPTVAAIAAPADPGAVIVEPRSRSGSYGAVRIADIAPFASVVLVVLIAVGSSSAIGNRIGLDALTASSSPRGPPLASR